MAKVTLPLGSATAHGKVGDVLVFQGETARNYVIPYDPKSEAQLDVRRLFHDVTGVVKRLGLLGRGLLAGYIGPRWYTETYKRVAENGAARLLAALDVWETFDGGQQDAWRSVSPFTATYNDTGAIFNGVAQVLHEWISFYTGGGFFSVPPVGGNAAAYRAAWDEGLTDVLTLAKANSSDGRLQYVNTWTTESDGGAYLGSYRKTSAANGTVIFRWRGKRLKIGFIGLENGGSMFVRLGGWDAMEIDQHRSSTTYNLSATLVAPNKGIHETELQFVGDFSQAITLDYLDPAN